jgi:hypothetical protein
MATTDAAEALAYLEWLQRMTVRTMWTARRFRDQVEDLAAALLERDVVGRRCAIEILDAAGLDELSGGEQVAPKTE